MDHTPDITFIGGGISGLLSARLFALAGARVAIIDQSDIGQEASWAGGGILLPLYPWRQPDAISQLVLPSIAYYPSLAQQLMDATGLDPDYTVSGLLMRQLDDLPLAIDWCQRYAIRYEQQDPHCLYLPDIAQVRNPRLLKALKQDLVQRGVHFIEQQKIEAISLEQNRITHIASADQRYAVQQVVLSSGAWSGRLWTQLMSGLDTVKVYPVQGQMLLFAAPEQPLTQMILAQDRYLIPRRDGKILCGSTVEHVAFNKATTDEARSSLTDSAQQLWPSLQQAPLLHHWAGLRPGTDHGIPYIDRHPDISNLAINAGHFRNGFAMGPASAQLLFELINGIKPSIDATAYQLTARH